MIELVDVQAAARRLDGRVHRTPVVVSRTLDAQVGAEVFCKAETLQRTGSFKIRGATNKVRRLVGEVDEGRRPPIAGVVTMSSGNHGAALACAASEAGLGAVVVMPEDAPSSKLAATAGYGAEIVRYDRYREDRDAIARAIAAERQLVLVPPYDDLDVMAGQGTLALELFDQAGPLDVLVVCVGGGGLISGCATVAKGIDPACRVVGVEPAAGDDTARSLAAGRRVRLDEVPRTIADGQAAVEPGELTWPVIAARVDEVVTVHDSEIVAAMRFCFERLRLVVEPSGACALAALWSGRVPGVEGRRVGVTLSGANIDPDRFAQLVASASER
ncbi:MAG: pyridoxal-phosphate dependent enzyme [Acidimicrobiia bacterium]|nr:pyridoxal-phosphate dependent enzyme [Acidimicrobiia bacterium]